MGKEAVKVLVTGAAGNFYKITYIACIPYVSSIPYTPYIVHCTSYGVHETFRCGILQKPSVHFEVEIHLAQ